MHSSPDLELVCCSMSSSNCCFLTCIQVSQEAGQVVWYSHLLKNFPQFVVIHTVKGFGIVNTAEVDVFLELACLFHDPTDVGNLIYGSSAFSKSSLDIWKFTVNILLKPILESFEHYFASVWDECNCVVVLTIFGIAFLLDCNENCCNFWIAMRTCSSPVAIAESSKFAGILSAVLSQQHLLGFEIVQLEFHHLPQLSSQWSFVRPTWVHIPECLALVEWSQRHGYLDYEDFF